MLKALDDSRQRPREFRDCTRDLVFLALGFPSSCLHGVWWD